MSGSGENRGRRRDATEKWLHDNDPGYDETKKSWQVPRTDALARSDTLKLDGLSEQEKQKLLEGTADA